VIIQTTNQHIDELSALRIMQQKEDWQEEYRGSDTELFIKTKQCLNIHLNQDLFMFAEVKNEQIIATCGIQFFSTMPQCCDNGQYGYICNVYTKPEYRKQGIQTDLFSFLMNFAKQKNIQRILLSSDNPEAIRIYKKFGFHQDDWAYKWTLG